LSLALGWLAAASASAGAETRVALVIGNGNYREIATLANPPNDAKDVGVELAALGFTVTTGVDLDQADMEREIADFAKAAASADVSLFYYGGHGLQVSAQNFLIPVDAQLHSEEDIYRHTVHFDDVLKAQEQGKGVHLVFLDACRTNPLKDAPASVHAEGLARVGNAAGFLIAFATQPDNVAFDGAGRNSPFAQSLLGHLTTVGQDISSMMIEVRKDVIATTGGEQIPWENSSLTQQFYFAPGEASGSPETLLWQLAGGQRDINLLHFYLERYPDGSHVAEANALRASLQETQGSDAPPGVVCERLATHPRDATANTPGVELDVLVQNAEPAIAACREAIAQHPDVPHYVALLARATAAAGRRDEAVGLYRKAADAGDARAMVSLGLILESGDGAPKDLGAANALYEKAAARGSADGAINLAVALMNGSGVEKNVARAASLLRTAAQGGSAIATYDLGVLAQQGVTGAPADALDLFRQTSSLGDPRGYLAAAILLDEGRGVPKDPAAAAEQLLRGVAGDDGSAFNQLTAKSSSWSRDTIKAVETRLKSAGYYAGAVDGKGGAALAPALKQWRLLGPPQKT
jgi:tetratricopeptide (TPR) repeat protein